MDYDPNKEDKIEQAAECGERLINEFLPRKHEAALRVQSVNTKLNLAFSRLANQGRYKEHLELIERFCGHMEGFATRMEAFADQVEEQVQNPPKSFDED